jgi:hypothetical protein
MKFKVVVLVFLSLFLSLSLYAGKERSAKEKVEKLSAILNEALTDDEPIKLVLGTDFLAEPGTVIFLSKDAGMKRMVEFARRNELEFSILFLPEWEAWITETKIRLPSFVKTNTSYLDAACSAGLKVGIGHLHNAIEIEPLPAGIREDYVLQTTMPSDTDFLQLYAVTREYPNADVFEFVSNILGVTYFAGSEKGWSAPIYVHYAVQQEGVKLNKEVRKLSSEKELPKFAKKHEGFIRLWFEPSER